ncbi:MAG: hypothetical protein IJ518_00475 [Clostridia bacterium]|nr:hypothetical protein [Clostridia bacterium]
MIEKRNSRLPERLAGFGGAAVGLLCLLLFGYVALYALTQTSVIDPENFGGEVILYLTDGPLPTLLLVTAYILLAVVLYRFTPPRRALYDHILTGVVVAFALGCGFSWIFLTQSAPGADSGTVFDTACRVIAGDFTDFHTSNNDFYGNISYYRFYPFQLGYVFLSELVYRLCGTETALPMQVVNVLALAALYAGLMQLARRLFDARWGTTLLAVLLVGCFQPIFFCAFTYGNLPGFAAGLWAGYMVVRYMQSEHRRRLLWLLPAAGLLVLAVVAKYNNMIWALALVLCLLLDALRRRCWHALPLLPVLLLLPLLTQQAIIFSYEQRSGVDLGDGVSQLIYLRDGLSESNMAPGWYNDLGKSLFVDCEGDADAANTLAKEDLLLRLEELADDPEYTVDFFRKKLLSQWNEPSYECLWVSQVKGHYVEIPEGSLVDNIYNGALNRGLHDWFNLYQGAVLVLFCAGVVGLLRRRIDPATATLLTVLLGGGLYHLLFEGKSQYILTYFILLVFFAAYGLGCLGQAIRLPIQLPKKWRKQR